jgi:hypothetical protein
MRFGFCPSGTGGPSGGSIIDVLGGGIDSALNMAGPFRKYDPVKSFEWIQKMLSKKTVL